MEKLILYNGPNSPFGRKVKITAIFHKIQLEEKIINKAKTYDISEVLERLLTSANAETRREWFRKGCLKAHPDKGGKEETFQALYKWRYEDRFRYVEEEWFAKRTCLVKIEATGVEQKTRGSIPALDKYFEKMRFHRGITKE